MRTSTRVKKRGATLSQKEGNGRDYQTKKKQKEGEKVSCVLHWIDVKKHRKEKKRADEEKRRNRRIRQGKEKGGGNVETSVGRQGWFSAIKTRGRESTTRSTRGNGQTEKRKNQLGSIAGACK